MSLANSLFIVFTITIFINNLSALEKKVDSIEYIHIDTIIQQYLKVESSLWYSISRRSNIPRERIHDEHNKFFSNESYTYLVRDELKLKFKKYLESSVFESYVRDDQDETKSTVYMSAYNGTQTNDLLIQIRKDTESQSCDNRATQVIESSEQNIFLFYQLFAALLLKAYANEQQRNMENAIRHHITDYDYKTIRSQFDDHYKRIGYLSLNQMKNGSSDIWMCDLDFYSKDDESFQITNLLQGYVENEVNLDKDSSCSGTCSDYNFARNRHCAEGTFCGDQMVNNSNSHVCPGTIVDCLYYESSMQICTSLSSNKRRRYDNIKFPSGRFMGREFCGQPRHEVSSYISKYLSYCSYCFCYCDTDTEDSDRYFSLVPAVSDISSNKIITGVGLIKRNGTFSWSITQSTLRSNGRVDQLPSNIIKSFSPSELNVDEVYQDFNRTEEGVNYHKLSWQNRSINLASVTVPHGSVVTGIKFTVLKEHLNFQIRATPFDFNTGILNGPGQWTGNNNERRSVFLLDRPEPSHPLPINSELCKRSIPNFEPNKFIKFRPTDPDKDVGQTTVPFIDVQMVRPKELMPLSGVSLYYKGRPGFGGFIAPKLTVYDMSKYIST